MQDAESKLVDAITLILAAILLLLAMSACAEDGYPAQRQCSDSDGWWIGATIADLGGDCRGAAWIDHYADTGDPGVDIIPRRPK
jgi:hypothetical protein